MEVRNALHDAMSRIQSMRILFEKLLIGSDYKEVSLRDYVESLIESIVLVYPESKKIEIKLDISDFSLPAKIITNIGIIINELLTNIFKYAFKGIKKGKVFISLHKEDDAITLIFKDNGVGINKRIELNKSLGFGLMIVKMLSEQLNGTFSSRNENGTISVLKFNLREV